MPRVLSEKCLHNKIGALLVQGACSFEVCQLKCVRLRHERLPSLVHHPVLEANEGAPFCVRGIVGTILRALLTVVLDIST